MDFGHYWSTVHFVHSWISRQLCERWLAWCTLSSIVKTRRLSLFGHIAWMNESTDASHILFEPPSEVWTKPRGRPRNSWVRTVTNDRGKLLHWASGSKRGCSGPGLLEDVYEAYRNALVVVHAHIGLELDVQIAVLVYLKLWFPCWQENETSRVKLAAKRKSHRLANKIVPYVNYLTFTLQLILVIQ